MKLLNFVSFIFLILIAASSKKSQDETTLNAGSQIEHAGRGTPLNQIKLVEDLTIGEQDTISFGNIVAIGVDSRGRVYVGDRQNYSIKIFSRSGELLRSLGRKGQGPGEFIALSDLDIGRGDSLFAFDVDLRRISAFAPNDSKKLVYTVLVPGHAMSYPVKMMVPQSRGFLIEYTIPFAPNSAEIKRNRTIRLINHKGDFEGDPVLVVPERQYLVEQSGGSVTVMPMPFGRAPIFYLGIDDTIFYGWNDSLNIEIYSLKGKRLGVFHFPHAAIDVTRSDVNKVIEFLGDELKKMVRKAKLPGTWPAFENLVVDDEGWLWVDVVTNDRTRSSWLVFDRLGQQVATVFLPNKIALKVIRNGYAYGIETDELEVQKIVRYQIKK
ncbi:MAG: 6-bladed beta-propeller [candidate division KSB1 bacterium]|nr:6-bladed beta-propeller [candidate division KSB1 bacterium]MDZ7367483.1 6-bladed beta-propeller [candidate division KSB1 bacterium]